ncbi:hypothetical protein HR13_01270 [Porphyromonas gulae]|nr:hypothetical protein HR13_01270 [Porphyromonas gulae]
MSAPKRKRIQKQPEKEKYSAQPQKRNAPHIILMYARARDTEGSTIQTKERNRNGKRTAALQSVYAP